MLRITFVKNPHKFIQHRFVQVSHARDKKNGYNVTALTNSSKSKKLSGDVTTPPPAPKAKSHADSRRTRNAYKTVTTCYERSAKRATMRMYVKLSHQISTLIRQTVMMFTNS